MDGKNVGMLVSYLKNQGYTHLRLEKGNSFPSSDPLSIQRVIMTPWVYIDVLRHGKFACSVVNYTHDRRMKVERPTVYELGIMFRQFRMAVNAVDESCTS